MSEINNLNKNEIPRSADEAEKLLREIFHNSNDLELQSFQTRDGKALVAYLDGLSNKDLVDRDIIYPLKSREFDGDIRAAIKAVYFEKDDFIGAVNEILKGNTVVIYDGFEKALIIDFKSWDKRAVDEPDAEAVIRGPKEGFTENFRTNTSLIRRKIRNPNLVIEAMEFGKQTKTVIALIYIAGIVNREVLRLVREKLNKINIDAVLETGYIEHLICKNNFSPVSGIGLTQKPDVLAGKILEGRVGIICDGSPHALIIPELFIENFHNSDDYYNQFVYTVFLRILRVLALFISVVLPGLFVAVTTYDQEMIPSVFLATLISSAQKTPMPIGAEIFLLVFMFELLRESGTRLPRTVGNAISIVGALIIGQAAVEAAIVSAPTIIIVALMAVSAFLLPNLTEFIVMYRLLFIIMGGILGLIGIGSAMVIMLVQLCSITSFGVPIFSSFKKQDLKDSVIRFPLKKLIYRPSSIAKDNVRRIDME